MQAQGLREGSGDGASADPRQLREDMTETNLKWYDADGR